MVLDMFQKVNETKQKNIKSKTVKADSPPRRQDKNISRSSKKFLNNVAASGFGILDRIMYCYF